MWKSAITPRVQYVKFRYADSYHFDNLEGETRLYSGNSIYDPDFSGVGTQPPGYDDYSGMYDKYKVVGSLVNVRWRNCTVDTTPVSVSTTAQLSGSALITAVQDTTGALNPRNTWNTKSSTLQGANFSGTGSVHKMYRSTKSMLGLDYQDSQATAAFGHNPTDRWYWALAAISYNSSDTLDVWVDISITYYCILYKRNELAQAND